MDIRKIKKLIELVKESEIAELQVDEGETSVKIVVNGKVVPKSVLVTEQLEPVTFSNEHKQLASNKDSQPSIKGHTIKAPMVGTVYLSSTPGAKPFVEIGQHVKVGETLCLIEAMKMFNKVESDVSGIVSACLIENSQATEYDQPLFIIEKG